MPENRISAALSQADQQAVLAAVQTIREKLPFLIDLSPEERRARRPRPALRPQVAQRPGRPEYHLTTI